MSQSSAPMAIAPLADAAPQVVEALLDAAFGPDRHGRTAYRLRAGTQPIPTFSFAAFEDDMLAGTLQSWPVALRDAGGTRHPLVLVGPVAVSPTLQRGGIGRRLMAHLLEVWDGGLPLVLIGDPEYYGRFFGFSAAHTAGWALPGPFEPRRLLALGAEALPAEGQLEARA